MRTDGYGNGRGSTRHSVAIALGIGLALSSIRSWDSTQVDTTHSQATLDRSSFVFVYEGYSAGDVAGCGGVSVFHDRTGEIVFQGPPAPGHGALTTDRDMTQVVAEWSQGGAGTLYRLQIDELNDPPWHAEILEPSDGFSKALPKGGIGISADGTTIISGESWKAGKGVATHRIDAISDSRLGPRIGEFRITNDSPAAIATHPTQPIAYLLTERAFLYTLDLDITAARESAVALPAFNIDEADPRRTLRGEQYFLTLAPDLRHLVTNRWQTPSLTSIDLKYGDVEVMDITSELTTTGGVAFNWGWDNLGLLAAHHGKYISVHEYDPFVPSVRELGRVEIESPLDAFQERDQPGYVAWSTDGSVSLRRPRGVVPNS